MKIIFDTKLSSDISIEYYKENKLKKIVYYIINILTLFLYNHYFSKYNYIFFTKTKIKTASLIKIKNKKTKEIKLKKLHKKKAKLTPFSKKKPLTYFTYKYKTYYYSKSQKKFTPIKNKLKKSLNSNPSKIKSYKSGLKTSQVKELSKIYQKNIIKIPKVNILKLFFSEILSPFTVYQLLCVLLWNLNDYGIYGDIVLFLTFGSVVIFVFQVFKGNTEMRRIVGNQGFVRVRRDQVFRRVRSWELVIGDLVLVEEGWVFCDLLLLKGKCILNEAMLTGETQPIVKSPFFGKNVDLVNSNLKDDENGNFKDFLKEEKEKNIYKNDKLENNNKKNKSIPKKQIKNQNIILCGTNCLLSKYKNSKAVAIVLNTGFSTQKGELVRSLLTKKPEEFQFNKHIIYFLLSIILITSIGFIFYLFFALKYQKIKYSLFKIILRGLEFFATAVPPTLPLCLTIGLEFSVFRLKKFGIYSHVMEKINEAGRVKIMCFDKTGTLTENGLIFKGFVGKKKNEKFFGEICKGFWDEGFKRCAEIFGCCHSLTFLDGEIIGDPLEIEMFSHSIFDMFEDDNSGTFFKAQKIKGFLNSENVYKLIKKIDFTSERKRFSCIIKNVEENKFFLFTKGAPNIIKKICQKKSIPLDFDEKYILYSQQGFRILGFGYKEIKKSDLYLDKKDLEKDLIFTGLICFENPLKKVTKKIIKELKDAEITNIMITGDNLLTALNVAINCGIIEKNINIWSGKLKDNKIIWEKIPNDIERKRRLSSSKMKIDEKYNKNLKIKDLKLIIKNCKKTNSKIILTGNAFEMLTKNENFQKILKNTLVFSNSNPKQKSKIVQAIKTSLKSKKPKYLTGFCGDGANDCLALKTANIGLSLSILEASIAAPFHSKIPNISNVPNLLKEGKASLKTGLQNFKYILSYSLYQFYGMLFNFVLGIDSSSGQYYFIDLITFFPVTLIMCFTESAEKLGKNYPCADLVNSEILVSVIGGNLLMFFGFLAIFFFFTRKESFLEVFFMDVDLRDFSQDFFFFKGNFYNFLFNQVVVLLMGIAVNKGDGFRKNWYSNMIFLVHSFFILGVVLVIVFVRTEDSYWVALFFNGFIRKLDFDNEVLFFFFFICFYALMMFWFENNGVTLIKNMFLKKKFSKIEIENK